MPDISKWNIHGTEYNVADATARASIAGKQDAPAVAGTAGQVLGLDNSLNPVWVNQSGGGTETLIYRDNTFANGVLLFDVVSFDFANNALELNTTEGLPTELSANQTVRLFMSYPANYKSVPSEFLLGAAVRIKAIGSNKVELYNYNGDLISFTDTGSTDPTRLHIAYKTTAQTMPSVDNLPSGHKIKVRLTIPLFVGVSSGGINAYDGSNVQIGGYSAYNNGQKNFMKVLFNGPSYTCSMPDTYSTIIGTRTLQAALSSSNFFPSSYTLTLTPIDGKYRGECYIEYWGFSSSNANGWANYYEGYGGGPVLVDYVKKLTVAVGNNGFFSPGTCFEVYDLGAV